MNVKRTITCSVALAYCASGSPAAFVAPVSLFATGCDCSQGTYAGNGCLDPGGRVELDLACGPSDLTTVNTSGACSEGSQPAWKYLGGANSVSVPTEEPGDCHIELVFASGYTFATDIQFVSAKQPCSSCSPHFDPASDQPVAVPNPGSTCSGDAGEVSE